MNDKLILTVYKATLVTSEIIRINKDALKLVNQVQLETGLSASKIVSEMIKFSVDKIEIREV